MTRDEIAERLAVVCREKIETSCGCLCICNGEPRMSPRHPPDMCDLCRLCRESEDLRDMISEVTP